MPDKPTTQSKPTQRSGLSIDEAAALLAPAMQSQSQTNGGDAAAQASEGPTAEPEQDGLEPEVTHLEAEESDAGGSDGEEAENGEADDNPEDADDAAKDPLYRVTVNGEEVEVPLSELIASYRRYGDYTHKTQALAEQRRAVETREQELSERESRLQAREVKLEQYDAALEALDKVLKAEEEQFANIDWDQLAEEDPIEAAKLEIKYRRHLERKAHLEAEAKRRQEERQEELREKQQATVKAFQAAMSKHFPQWADEGVRTKDWADMVKTAKGLEFTDDEIRSTLDARIFRLLHKAMRFDRIEAAKASAKQPARPQAQKPAAVVAPSGARPTARAGRDGNLRGLLSHVRRTGSIDAAAAAYDMIRKQGAR